jgi:RNA polymerase sigma-70 factor (ECF subfamily)
MTDMLLLIEPLIPALRRYARGLLGNPPDADDLVQDCLEHAIGRWHQRRADGNPRAWIFTILHNLAINRLNQMRRRGPSIALEDASDDRLAEAPTQENRLRYRDLMRALEELPDEQRSVVLLVTVEGLTYSEAAAVLSMPIGTVMSRLSRGRERLRRTLEGEPATATAPNLRRVK